MKTRPDTHPEERKKLNEALKRLGAYKMTLKEIHKRRQDLYRKRKQQRETKI